MRRHYGAVVPVTSYGSLGSTQSVPRVMRGAPVVRGSLVDVPLSARDLAGLESQGLARTLGSLSGCTVGDVPGESLAYGRAGYDPARRDVTARTGMHLQFGDAAGVVAGMSRTTMLLAAAAGIGLVYYLSKRK